MEADQGDLESLASLNWIGHTGTANKKTSSLDTREILQFLQLGDEFLFMFLSDFRAELEEY